MNNKELDLYLKFIFDYVQKYIELSKDFDSIEKKYGAFSTEKKSKKTSNVRAIHVLENFIADNIDIDIQQRLLISKLVDSIDNSSATDKKIADYFIETIGKQSVNRKKNLLENLKHGLNIINEFVLSNDTSFQEVFYLCKSNKEACSVKNCPSFSSKKEYEDNVDDCEDRRESIRVREQLDLKDHKCYKYCKLNHTHKIFPDKPKDVNQTFLSINIYPSVTPEQSNNPFKVCSRENCICCSIKYT
ncbi:MAG: hypothetical protein K5622_04420, partial [Endomicrobiaceae bacterium]|nr:hypothetical protein [Endomicrobiaceae bacterium]